MATNTVVHGLYSYRAMLNGGRLDEHSSLFRALREKQEELTAALGGDVDAAKIELKRILAGCS